MGEKLIPRWPKLRGRTTIGYTLFEQNVLHPAWIENGRRFFDLVVAGSSWCTATLTEAGLAGVRTVIQGVDPTIFHPLTDRAGEREFLSGRSVVFSGGKFELRKGQDVVIRAYKVLQDRHSDVFLLNAWYNPWPEVFETMALSPLIRFSPDRGPYLRQVTKVLNDNGIDLRRVITCPRQLNPAMSRLYHNTDVGLFPNRCEGGTNLVLMEYMACGKPVIAVNTTGHADIVNSINSVIIRTKGQITIKDNNANVPVAEWPEPDLDDTIDKLEWAYQNPVKLRELGRQAGQDLAVCTWRKTAQDFQAILREMTGQS